MKNEKSLITSIKKLSKNTYRIEFISDYLSIHTMPGQFFNISVNEDVSYILRRPFSVSAIKDNKIEIIFNVVGKGTKALSQKEAGDELDIIGPLGTRFDITGNYETAVLIGGGIGVAPFPFLVSQLEKSRKKYLNLFGFRCESEIIDLKLNNTLYSTDDGSMGYKGNVIDLFRYTYPDLKKNKLKIFSCGPNIMLKSLVNFCEEHDLDAEVSLESNMACGFGICQGCPVESKDNPEKYYFICKDGPCFNIKKIII